MTQALTTTTGSFAEINGLRLYYEIHGQPAGSGAIVESSTAYPLVLLHGALSATGTSFGRLLPDLAKQRQVIAVELQAHGHTSDREGPLSTEQMAQDVIALMRALGVEKADFFGYSLGSGVAMQVAMLQPDLARKLVLMGGVSYSPEGYYPDVLATIEYLTPEAMAGSPWQQEYAQTAPNPENWPALLAKVKQFNREYKGYQPEDIQSVEAPVLLITGDADIVRPEHVVELWRLLGGKERSQLAILPGTDHVAIVERAEMLLPMLEAFLSEPKPPA